VLWLAAAVWIGGAAAAATWDLGGLIEPPPLDLAAYEAAVADAPWLAGLYAARAQAAAAAGVTADAQRDYGRVLAALPGHPGTSLVRARLLARSGDPAARAQASADLDAAEKGFALQRHVLPERAPETERVLREIADLRRELQARSADPGKK
jgi:hypothetical protein